MIKVTLDVLGMSTTSVTNIEGVYNIFLQLPDIHSHIDDVDAGVSASRAWRYCLFGLLLHVGVPNAF